MIDAKVIADSINKAGNRLTTMQISLPKVLLAELNTHRALSKNFSSSRAIPVNRFNQLPSFEPAFYGKNQAGMTAKQEEIEQKEEAQKIWHETIEFCKQQSAKLVELGLHKQWANRLNDWHAFAYGIVSATEFDNFFNLRIHEDAQPEMRILAEKMRNAMTDSDPVIISDGQWHLPYVTEQEKLSYSYRVCAKISAARCCRVSYMKHDGTDPSFDDDIALYKRLAEANPPHMSPLEHQASASAYVQINGTNGEANFRGWVQHRKYIENGWII